jgi:hypothetical protein
MGNWNISIRGVGAHHNGIKEDVEQLTQKFVEDLKTAGHFIVGASVTTGSETLISPSKDEHVSGRVGPLKEGTP